MGQDDDPIETFEHAAQIVALYVAQGRIGPTREHDHEVETLLSHFLLLHKQQEPK